MDRREAPVVLAAGLQHDAAGGSVNPLDAEFSIKETHRFTVVVGLNGLVDHQDVALVHARSWEGSSSHAEEECRRTAGDQRLRDVQGLGVRGRHGREECRGLWRRRFFLAAAEFLRLGQRLLERSGMLQHLLDLLLASLGFTTVGFTGVFSFHIDEQM